MKLVLGTHEPGRVVCTRAGIIEIDATADAVTPPYVRNGTAAETAAFLRGVMSNDMPGPSAADAMPGTKLAAVLHAMPDALAYHGPPR